MDIFWNHMFSPVQLQTQHLSKNQFSVSDKQAEHTPVTFSQCMKFTHITWVSKEAQTNSINYVATDVQKLLTITQVFLKRTFTTVQTN